MSFETVLMVSAHPEKLYILSSSASDSLSSNAIEAANTFQEQQAPKIFVNFVSVPYQVL
jgi:hypothetical protein